MLTPRDPIFKGCTRPPMLIGVPLVPLVLMACGALLAGSLGTVLIHDAALPAAVALCLPIYLGLRNATRSDDQRLYQLYLNLLLRLRRRAPVQGWRCYAPWRSGTPR